MKDEIGLALIGMAMAYIVVTLSIEEIFKYFGF